MNGKQENDIVEALRRIANSNDSVDEKLSVIRFILIVVFIIIAIQGA